MPHDTPHHPGPGDPGRAIVVRAGAGRTPVSVTLFGCCPNHVKVASRDSAGTLALFEYHGRVRGGPPLHVHDSQDETYFVRDGTWLFEAGGERHRLGPGDTIFLPRRVPHSFCQLSEEGRLVFLFTPAGDMVAFFEALSRIDGPPAPDVEQALFESHGMRVVGPPIQVD